MWLYLPAAEWSTVIGKSDFETHKTNVYCKIKEKYMESVNIKELNEKIQRESSFVDLLSMEMGKVIVGQASRGESADSPPF